MRVVIDTNIYLSGLIFPGSYSEQVLNLARMGQIEVFCSDFILSELKKNLIVKFQYSESQAGLFIDEILKFTQIVIPTSKVTVISNKIEDNKILECAISSKAEYLITGDKKHLLPLKSFQSVKILTAKEFIETFRQ